MASRQLRSTSSKSPAELLHQTETLIQPFKLVPETSRHCVCTIKSQGAPLSGLSAAEATLLRRKQRKLGSEAADTFDALPVSPAHFHTSLASTLIFAQEAAGTAICISPTGLVLTCAHCIAEDQDEYAEFTSAWLLFYTGQAVQVKCLAWDPIRDLALLQIISAEADTGLSTRVERESAGYASFAFVPIPCSDDANSHIKTRGNREIYCIGQPGRDDLESTVARKTQYKLVEVSHGRLRGLVRNADPQDNSEIGTLKHDAWTYWGHSGAPLLDANSGELCGLHSSWDDQTGMRHGVPVVAVREFLKEFAAEATDTIRSEIGLLLV